MHYLIIQAQEGCQLVDFSDRFVDVAEELRRIRSRFESKRQLQHRVVAVYSQDIINKVFLCDEFGIPTQRDGYLVKLEDI